MIYLCIWSVAQLYKEILCIIVRCGAENNKNVLCLLLDCEKIKILKPLCSLSKKTMEYMHDM